MLAFRLGAFVVFGASTLVGACSPTGAAGSPPPAEFLVSGPDSTFWISTVSGHASMRGAPITLARVDNRFYELYAADDDRSYSDALLVGERLYRRDIITGDSVVVFNDTAVSHIADIYARTHPDERPLGPDEETEGDPATSATAELDILDVFGPFLSYEYHVDIKLPRQRLWHATRRGVLDLRTGNSASLSEVVGAASSGRLTDSAKRSFEVLRDSALHAQSGLDDADRKALLALQSHHFDPAGFALEAVDAKPAVTFAVPGEGEGTAGNLFELDPITVDSVDWWSSIRSNLPNSDGSPDVDRWRTPKYSVVARYDTSGVRATLSLADARKREWLLGDASGPFDRIDWLDQPPVSDTERAALRHAFNAAANYDGNARVASIERARRSADLLTRFTFVHRAIPATNASRQNRQRKSARNVRAHDARALQQHGQCVRRCNSLHDG
jgi:hypothetical protein